LRQAAFAKFVGKARFIRAFQQSGPEQGMHLHGGVYYLARYDVEFFALQGSVFSLCTLCPLW